MNPAAVLGLISNLYERIVVLEERNELLERALTQAVQGQSGDQEKLKGAGGG